MEKTIRGSLGAASAFQMTEDMSAKDKPSKKILHYREVLAIILKETVEEYQGYYLSRRLCSQLDLVTEKTDYGQPEYDEGRIREN